MKKQPKCDVTMEDVRELVDWIVIAGQEVDRVSAQMNAELQAVRVRYAKLAELTQTIEDRKEVVETFATRHKDLFVDPRYLDLGRAVIGFRLAPHEAKLRRGTTWKEVALYIVAQVEAGILDRKYLRYWDPEVNKEALIEDREKLALDGSLDAMGVKMDQADKFYLEPKRDAVPAAVAV